MKKIIDKFYHIFGYHIQIRILPDEFKADEKRICTLIDDEKFVEAKVAIEAAYKRWGSDPDLIRLDTFSSFMDGW